MCDFMNTAEEFRQEVKWMGGSMLGGRGREWWHKEAYVFIKEAEDFLSNNYY